MTTQSEQELIQREKILEHGFEVITQDGVRAFTIEYLARNLGMSKKTIYKHFPTKEELVKKIAQYMMGQVGSAFEMVREKESNPVRQFLMVMEFIAEMAGRFPQKRLGEFKGNYPDIWYDIETFRLDRREDFYQMLSKAQAMGLARSELNMKVLATIYIHIVNSTFQPEFFMKNDLPIGDTIRGFVSVVARGILTEKGMKIVKNYNESK